MLSLLLSLLHVVVVIYNPFVMKKSLSVITLFYNTFFVKTSLPIIAFQHVIHSKYYYYKKYLQVEDLNSFFHQLREMIRFF